MWAESKAMSSTLTDTQKSIEAAAEEEESQKNARAARKFEKFKFDNILKTACSSVSEGHGCPPNATRCIKANERLV
jgi:hypothetical protein